MALSDEEERALNDRLQSFDERVEMLELRADRIIELLEGRASTGT